MTTHPSSETCSSWNRCVCQASSSSVIPLNVLPSITKPPAGSRAPRCRFDNHPRRRPEPHSTARTTRSSVCRGFTFTQPAPRRPASYGAFRDFTTTPSCPAAIAADRTASASSRDATSVRETSSGGGSTRSSTARRSAAGSPVRSAPSTCRQSKKNGRSGMRVPAPEVALRAAVA